jgi:hypothetical protein
MHTFGGLLNLCKLKYGLVTEGTERYLADALYIKMNQICSEFFSDFMRVLPNPSFRDNFPITTLSSLAKKDTWLSRGWFYTTDGVSTYLMWEPVYSPVIQSGSGVNFESPWIMPDVRSINNAWVFDTTGINKGILGLIDYSDMLNVSSLLSDTQGQPTVLSLVKDGSKSILRLDPEPDGEYIVAVDYNLHSFPPVDSGSYTNPLMMKYPDLMIELTMELLYEHHHKYEEASYHHNKIYGPRGLLQRIRKQERRNTTQGNSDAFSIHGSMAASRYNYATSQEERGWSRWRRR